VRRELGNVTDLDRQMADGRDEKDFERQPHCGRHAIAQFLPHLIETGHRGFCHGSVSQSMWGLAICMSSACAATSRDGQPRSISPRRAFTTAGIRKSSAVRCGLYRQMTIDFRRRSMQLTAALASAGLPTRRAGGRSKEKSIVQGTADLSAAGMRAVACAAI